MAIFGKSSLIVIGVIILIAGFLLRSGFIEWLLDVMGLILIIVGIIVVVVGLVSMVTGKGGSSREF